MQPTGFLQSVQAITTIQDFTSDSSKLWVGTTYTYTCDADKKFENTDDILEEPQDNLVMTCESGTTGNTWNDLSGYKCRGEPLSAAIVTA